MPSNWLYMDTNFPTFTGQETVREQVNTIQNYLFMLVEEMRYSLRNLDGKNFNATGLDRIGEAITQPVYAKIRDQDGNITQLQVEATGLATRIGDAEGNITQLQAAATSLSVTLASAQGDIAQLQATADGLTARISNAEGSITTLTTTADGFRRDFTSLTGRFTTIEETVKGVTYTGPDGKVWINNGSINLTGSITWGDLTSDVQNRVGGVTEDIVHTLIKNDLVASPNIKGANIYGTTYWNTEASRFLTMKTENDQYGFFHLGDNAHSGTPLFSIFDEWTGGIGLKCLGRTFLHVDGYGRAFPQGTWDFSDITVKGPKFSQVSSLTSDHTEFYLYIVFGGVGVYTPVFAATLGRTYTTAAATDNGEYPIYGIIFNVSTNGAVSVSKIYGVYPYSKHQSGIDYTVSSITIYAR